MRKLVVALVIVLATGSAYAQSVQGKLLLGGNVDLGVAFPSGTLHTLPGEDYSKETALAYGFAAKVGFGLTDSAMLIAGLGYEYRPIPLKYDYGLLGKGDLVLQQDFYVLDLACRFIFTSNYLDLGAFYGMKASDGKYKMTGDINTDGKLKDLPGSTKERNPFGLIIGLGHLIKISDALQIDIGLKFKPELTNQYEESYRDWKLKSNTLSLTIGANVLI